MKIRQISPTKYYQATPDKYSSLNCPDKGQNNYVTTGAVYNCNFKGFTGLKETLKQNVKKTFTTTVSNITNTASNIQKNMIEPIYNKFFARTTKPIKPKKAQKNIQQIVPKAAKSIIPEPNFSMDYKKVLNDLQTMEEIDTNWVKSNTAVLKAVFGYKDTNMSEQFFKIQTAEINRARNEYIEEIMKLQTKEKAEYIKSIRNEFIEINPPFKPINKEKNISGLQALQKYGTRDDFLKLNAEYRLSEDSDIMKEYAKLAGIVGLPSDIIPLRAKINDNGIKTYTEETISEIMNTLKILMVDKAKQGYFKNASYDSYREFEKLSTHKNNKIAENAKAIMKRLSDENPWMLE